ncbi:MAG: MFS transporter [Clostridiales Family XIII bacterium]|jgi:NNP family nitrate/nitrite transporter-like MFS transporter|nr:MFS transporter [Clostridiales Family XIII bacterium]
MKERPPWYKWIIVACCCLTSMSAIYGDSVLVPRALEVMQTFSLTPQQFAMVATAGLLIPVFISFFVGGIADKIGAKNIVIVGYIITIVAGVARMSVTSFWPLFILTFLAATCGAIMNAIVAKILSAWLGVNTGRGIGIMVALAMLGQAAGTATGALYPTLALSFLGAAIVAAVSLLVWILLVQERPAGVPAMQSEKVTQGMGVVLSNKSVWFAGLGLFFFMGGNITTNKFLAASLTDVYQYDVKVAGVIASVLSIGLLCGNLLWPNLSIKIGRQKPILVSLGILAAVFTYVNYLVAGSSIVYVTTFVIGFFAGGLQPIFMTAAALIPDIPAKFRGTAGGAISTLMMLGAFFVPSYVVTPIAGANYGTMFLLAAVCFVIISVLMLFAPDVQVLARKQQTEDQAAS